MGKTATPPVSLRVLGTFSTAWAYISAYDSQGKMFNPRETGEMWPGFCCVGKDSIEQLLTLAKMQACAKWQRPQNVLVQAFSKQDKQLRVGDWRAGKDRIEQLLALGATRWEATQASLQRCVRVALTPILNQMNVVGIVSIPGECPPPRFRSI